MRPTPLPAPGRRCLCQGERRRVRRRGVWRQQRSGGLGPLHDRPAAIIVVRLGSRRRRARCSRPSRLQLRIAPRCPARLCERPTARRGRPTAGAAAGPRPPPTLPPSHPPPPPVPSQAARRPAGRNCRRPTPAAGVPRRHIMRAVLHLRRRRAAAAAAAPGEGGPGCFERGLLGEGRRGAAADLDPGGDFGAAESDAPHACCSRSSSAVMPGEP